MEAENELSTIGDMLLSKDGETRRLGYNLLGNNEVFKDKAPKFNVMDITTLDIIYNVGADIFEDESRHAYAYINKFVKDWILIFITSCTNEYFYKSLTYNQRNINILSTISNILSPGKALHSDFIKDQHKLCIDLYLQLLANAPNIQQLLQIEANIFEILEYYSHFGYHVDLRVSDVNITLQEILEVFNDDAKFNYKYGNLNNYAILKYLIDKLLNKCLELENGSAK